MQNYFRDLKHNIKDNTQYLIQNTHNLKDTIQNIISIKTNLLNSTTK